MKALAIAGANLRRTLRQPASVFFVLILPLLLILLLGASFGGGTTARIGVVARDVGPLGEQLVAALEARDVSVRRLASERDLVRAVERGRVNAGLSLPEGYDGRLRRGEAVVLPFFARPDSLGQQVRPAVQAAISGQSALVAAARFAAREAERPFASALAEAAVARIRVPGVAVGVVSAATGREIAPSGRFDQGAGTQLLLFVFLTSLTGATALIETRRLGISRRMLATPTAPATIIGGELLGRFGVALFQALVIMLGSVLLFGVDWGDPLGASLVVLLFCLVGSGAGLLLGALLRTEQQSIGVSLLLGLGLAALGGSMVPLEVFPDTVRRVAHATPHAWGNDAFAELLRGGGVDAIGTELAVLAALATALLALATWRLRGAIAR